LSNGRILGLQGRRLTGNQNGFRCLAWRQHEIYYEALLHFDSYIRVLDTLEAFKLRTTE
jgi:hypothetical protein